MQAFIDYILKCAQLLRITDLIDILLVAVVIYYMINIVKETRAKQLIKGIALILGVFFASQWLNLNALNYILENTLQVGAVAVIVLFQPELRTLLEKMGRINLSKFLDFANGDDAAKEIEAMIESVVKAAADMSGTKTGALIVLEREMKLAEHLTAGISLDANVSSILLENIFFPNTPLHDGAVIIRGNKIVMAACFLPLTSNSGLSSELGTRHRAAIGLSEVSDAVIVVVSEETGKISIAREGSLSRNYSEDSLRHALKTCMAPLTQTNEKRADVADKLKFRRAKK